MKRQKTFASAISFEKYRKPTKRELFLAEMEQIVPWKEFCALLEPFYPKEGKGRPPIGLERMLRIHFLQNWFNLSDPGVEEALYDVESMRRFARIDLGNEPVPDETTICKFRHLLETHKLAEKLFEAVNLHLASRGLKLSAGTIVDATIIHAPSSTKNREKKRDPEMHSTKKGNQYYFGMKVHVGVDKESKQVHSLVTKGRTCTTPPESVNSCTDRPTWAKPKRSGRKPRAPWIIPKKEPRSTKSSPKKRKSKTVFFQKSVRGLNMSSTSSNASSDSPKCAIKVSPKIPVSCTCSSLCAISTWREVFSCPQGGSVSKNRYRG